MYHLGIWICIIIRASGHFFGLHALFLFRILFMRRFAEINCIFKRSLPLNLGPQAVHHTLLRDRHSALQ